MRNLHKLSNLDAYDFETEERWSRPKKERIQRKANRHSRSRKEAQLERDIHARSVDDIWEDMYNENYQAQYEDNNHYMDYSAHLYA